MQILSMTCGMFPYIGRVLNRFGIQHISQIRMQPSHSKSTPAWNIIFDSTSCTTSGSVNSGTWFAGLLGLFIHGGLLKNLRFAVAGDHAPVDDLGDSCALESDDWDKAASLCFNFKVVGSGIVQTKKNCVGATWKWKTRIWLLFFGKRDHQRKR